MNEREPIPDHLPSDLPLFAPGQLVRHRRYGYRGVIVDFDIRCLANEEWYDKNQTQPTRDQAWYHVLVDGSSAVTYAAEENLTADVSEDPIAHPLTQALFERTEDGVYRRNDRAWPGWA